MYSLIIFALTSLAIANAPRPLRERQGTITVSGGELIPCSPQYICGDFCRPQNYFCCDLVPAYPCPGGTYCLGFNTCCFGYEAVEDCAARNSVTLPPGFTLGGTTRALVPPPTTPTRNLETPTVVVPTTTYTLPIVSPTYGPLPLTPSYPAGNASIPAPTNTGTGAGTPGTVPFTGDAVRVVSPAISMIVFLGTAALFL